MKNLIYILIVFLPLIGCQKKWKKTSVTNFSLSVIKEKPDVDYITITEGQLYLASFHLEGERKKGNEVHFQEDFSSLSVFDIAQSTITPVLSYDLPQGEYTSLHIDLTFGIYDTIGSIIIKGFFKDSNEADVPFIFRLEDRIDIEIESSTSTGENVIVQADQVTEPVIMFDVVDWFEQIPEEMFDDADEFDEDGVQTVLISKTENYLLYSLILDRIGETATVTF